jgi:hypothetical protein
LCLTGHLKARTTLLGFLYVSIMERMKICLSGGNTVRAGSALPCQVSRG